MTLPETTDLIINYFAYGALGYNILCCVYYIFKYSAGIKIRMGERVTYSQIENRMALKLKLQTHGVMLISLLYLCYCIQFIEGRQIISMLISLTCCYFIIEGFGNLFGETLSSRDVTDLSDFSLYLRPFVSDINHKTHKNEKIINKVFSDYCQVFSIGNPSIVLPSLGTTSVFASDDEWKDTVSKMMDKAKIIILRVGQSKGSQWEMNYCKENNLETSTLFIVDSKDAFYELSDTFDISKDCQFYDNGTYAFYFSALDDKWSSMPANNRRQIKEIFVTYLKSHPNNLSQYLDYKEKKKSFLKYIFKTKNFPEQISLFSTGIITNPINYVVLNRWSIPFIAFLVITYEVSFIVANKIILPLVWEIKHIGFISLPLYFYMFAVTILCIIYAPRISWLSKIWPSVEMYKWQNRKMNRLQWTYILSFIVYFLCISLFVYLGTGQPIILK